MLGTIFSFEGRAGRMAYIGFFFFWLLVFVGLFIANIFLYLDLPPFIFMVLGVVMMLSGIALTVRRLHDMGISGWAVLFMILLGVSLSAAGTAVSIYPDQVHQYFVAHPESAKTSVYTVFGLSLFAQFYQAMLIFWPGDEGTNRFG